MSKNDAIKKLLEDEQRLGLWEVRLAGFPIWCVERLLHYRLLKDGVRTPARTRAPRAARFDAWLRTPQQLLSSFRRIQTQRDVWVLSSSRYRQKLDQGTLPNIFTPDLETQLGSRLLFWETNDAELPISNMENVIDLGALRSALRLPARGAYRTMRSYFTSREPPLFDLLPPDRHRSAIVESIFGQTMYELGLTLMKLKRPKAIFVLCAYSGHIPFQLAARKLGIPIIELQHGMIHESHPGYILPELDEAIEHRLPFPDHLVVFGEYFGKLLDRESARWRGRWSVGGQPWLRRLAAQTPTERSDPSRADAPGTQPRVVFFSQFETPVREQVDRIAAELARRTNGYRISIKPHPREQATDLIYGNAASAGVEILPSSENSYQLLRRTDVAISVYSTVAVEALAYPCRSIVLTSSNWSEAIESLVAQGYLEPATDAADLVRLLEQSPATRKRGAVAQQLFGIGEPTLDFEALVERCVRDTAIP